MGRAGRGAPEDESTGGRSARYARAKTGERGVRMSRVRQVGALASERVRRDHTRLIRAERAAARRIRLRNLSLAGAALLAVSCLTLLAALVLYLTGKPWERGWGWTWQADAMSWKDRLTYAGAVVTATGAVVALVVSYRKQRDDEDGRFAAQFAAAAQLGMPLRQ
mgnify:CR=1 FL=1